MSHNEEAPLFTKTSTSKISPKWIEWKQTKMDLNGLKQIEMNQSEPKQIKWTELDLSGLNILNQTEIDQSRSK